MDDLNGTPLLIAAEDLMTLACAWRLIKDSKGLFYVYNHTGLTGNAELREQARELARSAMPHQLKLLITDLDSGSCPAALRREWLGPVPLPESMLFRVAVREVEAWVMADRGNFAEFFEVPTKKISDNPEGLSNPKDELLRVIYQYSKRPDKGEIATVDRDREPGKLRPGPRYNKALSEFVLDGFWNPENASETAPSLDRTRQRIEKFAHKFAPLNPAAEAPCV